MKNILKYLKGYKLPLSLSLILALIQVTSSLSIPILIGKGIDCIIAPGNVDYSNITRLMISCALIVIVGATSQWLMGIISNRITYGVIRDMRNEAICKIQSLPLSYIDSHPSGDLVSRIIADVDQFADGLLMGFSQLFTGVITILGTLFFMLSLSPLTTALVVILTPLSFLVARFIATHTHDMFALQSKTRGEQTSLIDELIGNQKVVKAYSREKEALLQFDEINDRLSDCSKKAVFYSSLTNPCTRFVNSLVYAAVAVVGAFLVIKGHLSIGGLSSFLSYANQYTKPFNEISGVVTELHNSFVCANRVIELISAPSQTPDAVDATVLSDINGKVSLDNVSFSYTKEQRLIEDFNLSVKPGQKVAIVGPTGCGKTTIINLLMRFYDIDSGTIAVDDYDTAMVTRRSLRQSYGMVLQETWLRHGTILDNIRIAKPDASREEIINAAKLSHAHSFIRRLPDGYDTMIGEDGGTLSAGQRQLLCITRVMLMLPPMLILDEATSSIDTRTEQKIQSAFLRMMKGRTSFIVAHRLSTIQNADIILVMNDGKIIEQGDHNTLLSKNGFYAKLYNSQFIPS